METFKAILFIFLYTSLAFCIYLILKNTNTYNMHYKLSNAIHTYNISVIDKHEYDKTISYDIMEEYNATLWRLFDWGYTRILPPDILELVKPYIEEGK